MMAFALLTACSAPLQVRRVAVGDYYATQTRFVFGAQGGDGAMFKGGKTVGYYRTLAASYGFQAGMQKFGYALFFVSDSALEHLSKSGGLEVGTGPSLVVVDEGFAKSMSTTTLTQDVYAYVFDQKGLMAGVGIQGSKITRIHPR